MSALRTCLQIASTTCGARDTRKVKRAKLNHRPLHFAIGVTLQVS
jgi:hypothetical protein